MDSFFPGNLLQPWLDAQQSMIKTTSGDESMDVWARFINNMFTQQTRSKTNSGFFESLGQMIGAENAFREVHNLFDQLFPGGASGLSRPKGINDVLSQWNTGYMQLLSGSFAATLPNPLKNIVQEAFSEQAPKNDRNNGAIQSLIDEITDLQQLLTAAEAGDEAAYTRYTQRFNTAFGDSCGKLMQYGKLANNEDLLQLHSESLTSLQELLESTSRFAGIMIGSSQETLERVVKEFQSDTSPKSFDDFYSLWLNENRRSLQRLLMNTDFYLLSSQISTSSSKVGRNMAQLSAKQKELLSFPSNAEISDLFSAVQELNQEIMQLRKE